MECLARNEVLGDLSFELDAMGAVLGHGFHPLKARQRPVDSQSANCPPLGAHSKWDHLWDHGGLCADSAEFGAYGRSGKYSETAKWLMWRRGRDSNP